MLRHALYCGILGLGLSLTVPAWGQEGPPREPDRPREPGALIERNRQAVFDLNLTEAQRADLEKVFASARQEWAQLRSELADASPEVRRQRIQALMTEVRSQVDVILTDEQKAQLRDRRERAQERLRERQTDPVRPGPADRPGVDRPAPGDRPLLGGMLERMSELAMELDLTDAQRDQIRQIVQEARTKLSALREQAAEDPQALREQVRPIVQQARESIQAVLTEEQRQALREKLQAQRPQRPQGPGDRAGLRERAGDRPGIERERPRLRDRQSERPEGERPQPREERRRQRQ